MTTNHQAHLLAAIHNGRDSISPELVKHGLIMPTLVRADKGLRGRKKECFYNAFVVALANPDMYYCEGFAVWEHIPVPIHHAMVLDHNGLCHELTTETPPDHFMAIPFNTAFVKKHGIIEETDEKAVFHSILGRSKRKCPLSHGNFVLDISAMAA